MCRAPIAIAIEIDGSEPMVAKQQSLYIVDYLGRDTFVWASSAAEARAEAATPSPTVVSDAPLASASNLTMPRSNGKEQVRAAKGTARS